MMPSYKSFPQYRAGWEDRRKFLGDIPDWHCRKALELHVALSFFVSQGAQKALRFHVRVSHMRHS